MEAEPVVEALVGEALNDAPVLGARLASSVISKSPQLVLTVATYVLDGSSCSLGFGASPLLGRGGSRARSPTPAPRRCPPASPSRWPRSPTRRRSRRRRRHRRRARPSRSRRAGARRPAWRARILARREAQSALARYDHVLLDLDGCLWVGDDVLEGAARRSRRCARPARASRSSPTTCATRRRTSCASLAARLPGGVDEVVTCGAALQFTLAERARRRRGVRDRRPGARRPRRRRRPAHRQQHGVRHARRRRRGRPGTTRSTTRELRIATQAVLRGAELIGVTRDRTFPMPDGPWPASGALLAAVEEATGRAPSAPWASRSRTCTRRPATGSARALPRGRRPARHRRRGRRRAGMDSALVLTGGSTARPRRDGPTRSPRTSPTRSPRWCAASALPSRAIGPCARSA